MLAGMRTHGPPAYKLVEISAAGTFGTVCVAMELATGRLVALKVLKQAHLHRPRVIARIRDEATILSRIQHPGVARVDGLIEIEGRPIVVMEWIRGASLEALVASHPEGLPPAVAIELIRRAAGTLDHAYHAKPSDGGPSMGIIHRDIKPSNMLLSVRGELKVVDFGIAHGHFEGREAQTLSMVLGARGYLAPERLDGQADRPSCDVYSLGICLFELLTGRHVALSVHHGFHAEALHKHLSRLEPPGIGDEALATLRGILADMCAYDEARRPPHAELVSRLDDLLHHIGREPTVEAWAAHRVVPLFARRSRPEPTEHASYADLAFIDRTARGVRPAPPDIDKRLTTFLQQRDWPDRIDELELLLLENPHWTLAPFLRLLPDQIKPWWRFWGSSEADPAHIVAALSILERRPTAEARRRVLPLRRHPDARVVRAANAFLDLG